MTPSPVRPDTTADGAGTAPARTDPAAAANAPACPAPPVADHDPALEALRTQLARLMRATRKARGHGNQYLDGLSIPQFNLVEPLLDADEPLAVGRLADLASTTAPTATTMIRKLEEHGLIERSPHPVDRRVVRVALTEAGRQLVRERRQRVAAWRIQVASSVAPADREAGARTLAAIADEIERTIEALSAPAADDDAAEPRR